MSSFNYLKWTVLGASLMGLVGCGFNQGMQAKKSTGLSVEQFSGLYGEMPPTKSGSQVTGVTLLSDNDGSSIYGSTNSQADLFDGVRSHSVDQGVKLRLIAEVETRDGSKIYLAQMDQGNDLLDGYVAKGVINIVAATTTAAPVGTREDQPIVVPENTPAPPAPVASCPDIKFSFFDTEKEKERIHTRSLMGHNFRDAAGFDGGYEWTYNLYLSSGIGAKAIAINIKNKTTGEAFEEKVVKLDGTHGVQEIPFIDFVPKNEWYADKIRFDIAFMAAENETPSTESIADCGINTELSSPIVFDFHQGNTFKTTSLLYSNASFDLDADGNAEQTGWIAKDTALLAMDLNNNGQIDNGSELFGNFTKRWTGEKAANGYEALADYLIFNGNNKTILKKQNPVFDQLILWFDSNNDGVSQFSEMKYLDQAGVTGIETAYQTTPDHELSKQPFANQVKYNSNYYGSHCPEVGCKTYDVWFSTISPLSNQAHR